MYTKRGNCKRIITYLAVLCIILPIMLIDGMPAEAATLYESDQLNGIVAGQPGEFKNLGAQITTVNNHEAAFGKDKNGRDVTYTGLVGDPSLFVIADVVTEKVLKEFELPKATGVRGITVATDGSVYIGTHTSGNIYRYDPMTEQLEDIGNAIGITHIYKLVSGKNGEIYGATYHQNPALGSKVFKYHPKTGFEDYGTMVEGENYAMSLAYDGDKHKLYVGIGAHPALIVYDIATGEKKDILPEKFKDNKYVEEMRFVGNRLFAKMNPSKEMPVFDTDSYELVNTIPTINSKDVSPLSPDGTKVYYTNASRLHYYDITNDTYGSIGANIGANTFNWTFLEIPEEGPGYTLVGSIKQGILFKYNFERKSLKKTTLPIHGAPVEFRSIGSGPDGKIYTGGYLSGGLGVYNPIDNTSVQYEGIGQTERMGISEDKLYIGHYPRAQIYEFDPSKPWKVGTNPVELFRLNGEYQDRAFDLLPVKEYNKLFIGTVPESGKNGGALTVYDFSTKEYQVHRNIVENQSVLALVNVKDEIIGATTIYGGLGIQPTETEAKLFIWDIESSQKVYEIVPVPGKRGITDLIVGPDNNVWGMAEGTLFIFDPVKRKVIYSEEKFPEVNYDVHVWRDAQFVIGKDKNVYGTINGKLFCIDSWSKKITILRESEALGLAQDRIGNLYFWSGSDLWKYEMFTEPGHLVTFESYEGEPIGKQIVADGKLVIEPETPILKGHIFDGWYLDADRNIAYNFSTPVVGDVTLYAKWHPIAVSDIVLLIDQFAEEGEFANHGAATSLKAHLNAAAQLETQGAGEKVVKQMNDFIAFLELQRDKERITSRAYLPIIERAKALIEKWQLDTKS